MHSTWRNQNDVMDDIWALSEMEGMGNHEIEEPPPPTILEYRAQMAANNTGSVYDTPEIGPENITYKISGVGRGRFGSILRPGIPGHSDHIMTEEVKRKIRQVSGVGYSNALIEQGVKAMTMARNGDTTISTSQKTSPTKTASNKPSGLYSPNPRSISSASVTSTSPHSEAVEEAGPPPPLSVMRKKAEEERLKSKQNGSSSVEVAVKQSETPPKKNSPRPFRNSKRSPWQSTSPGSSSDEGSWRRRDGNSPNRFFKPRANGFNLNCEDFPALK